MGSLGRVLGFAIRKAVGFAAGWFVGSAAGSAVPYVPLHPAVTTTTGLIGAVIL